MRKLAFGALFVGLVAACGGSSSSNKKSVVLIGSGSGSGGDVCNVLTQTGCDTGQMCTWIVDMADMTSSVGHIGCAPAGTKATDAACTRNAPGATGYDDCVKGDYCFGPDIGGAGVCKQICDQAGGSPNCDSAHACVTYDGLFGPSGMAVAAGVCEVRCNPITDNNFLLDTGDSRTTMACGSAGSAGSNGSGFLQAKGCYGFPYPPNGATQYTCTSQYNYSRFHRTACDTTQHPGDRATCGPDSTHVYINGCASGYMPLFSDNEGSSVTDCMAFCSPAPCYNNGSGATSDATSQCAGGSNIRGNPAAHNCTANTYKFATFNQAPYATSTVSDNQHDGEQCFYSWLFEIDSTSMMWTGSSATSDTVGFCVDHSQYKFDPTGGSNNNTTWPRCDQVGIGSNGYENLNGTATTVGNGFDAVGFGCVDSATATAKGELFNGKAKFKKFSELRVPYHHAAYKLTAE